MVKIITSQIKDGDMRDPANREQFYRDHSIRPTRVVEMQQVHGNRIGVVKRPQLRARTDGLITKNPDLWLVVSHADCIPLFFIDEEIAGKFKPAGAVGVAHVGWKGATNGLVSKMVGEMVKHFKSDLANIKVKFGPFICNIHYDVRSDDPRTKLLRFKPLKQEGKVGLDLKEAVVEQLIKAGIKPENIDSTAECTAEHPEKYWSYHAAHGKLGGVMVSVIGIA